MEIIPAIDIQDNRCVRLFKGKKGTEKIYFEDPLGALDFWIEKGANRLHFVDLDGAWGSDKNKQLLKQMIQKADRSGAKVQIGGGIRSIDAAVELVKIGADKVIIGTMAVKNPDKIQVLSERMGSEHVIVALDYKSGKIATHGWTKETDLNPFTFGKKIEKKGAGAILFSSVEADGAFTGPDIPNIKKMVKTVNIPVYAAGGVRNERDIETLNNIKDLQGVIIGKAFYEKQLPFDIIQK
ncbi:MAG: 1-(5-phosphoribosyl)-5-[(5-phosphoribosylamino)methylideneamino]imidazole-4-carboxamide isomerase [Promethearchaeia archaeon]